MTFCFRPIVKYKIGPISGTNKMTKNQINLSVAVSNLFFKTSTTAIKNRINELSMNNRYIKANYHEMPNLILQNIPKPIQTINY